MVIKSNKLFIWTVNKWGTTLKSGTINLQANQSYIKGWLSDVLIALIWWTHVQKRKQAEVLSPQKQSLQSSWELNLYSSTRLTNQKRFRQKCGLIITWRLDRKTQKQVTWESKWQMRSHLYYMVLDTKVSKSEITTLFIVQIWNKCQLAPVVESFLNDIVIMCHTVWVSDKLIWHVHLSIPQALPLPIQLLIQSANGSVSHSTHSVAKHKY